MDAVARSDRLAATYGVQETNPADIRTYLDELDEGEGYVPLSDPSLVKIERLRLIGCSREYPFWDVSYCYGRLDNGHLVRVDLGTHRIDRHWSRHLVELCKEAGRYGKDLGIFDAVSTLRG